MKFDTLFYMRMQTPF